MKKFTYISLGCKVNSYESSAVAKLLLDNGYIYSDDNPDVAFINTCSVTATADQKSRQHIRKLMNKYPDATIVVMGCYSEGHHEFIKKEIKPHILLGTNNRNKILDYINEYNKTKLPIDTFSIEKNKEDIFEEFGEIAYAEHSRAYLKIEDGCTNFCTYCLIPYLRRGIRCRSRENSLKEANYLVSELNKKEIVLTGIHVGAYNDLSIKGGYRFSSLVEDLLNINNLYRLRISSIEASEIDDKLIKLINERDNLANHFHIPLQSGSDTVLKRMNRKYDTKLFYEKISKIRESCPNVALTTDVIVGFPGESEEEFLETYNFIKKCGFNMLHVFPYSAREGTVAAKMKEQIDPKIKKERCLKLIELSNELWNIYSSNFINKEVEVLIESYDEKNHLNYGHTSNYLDVYIPGEMIEPGTIIKTIYKK